MGMGRKAEEQVEGRKVNENKNKMDLIQISILVTLSLYRSSTPTSSSSL